MRPALRSALAALVAGAILAFLVARAGPNRLLEILRNANLVLVGAALLCYALFFTLRGLRWSRLLQPLAPDASAGRLTAATAVGWLGNNVFPMRAGEFLRAGIVARRERVPFFSVASTIAVERVLDVAGLALAAAASLLILPATIHLPPWAAVGLQLAAVLPLVALAALAFLALQRERVFGWIGVATRILPERIARFVLKTCERLADGAEPLVRRPRMIAPVAALTLAMTLAQAGLYAFLLLAFMPTTPPALALAGAPWFILTFAVAVTPANVGTYEAAFVAVYASLGLPATELLAVAVLTHLTTFFSVVLLGSLGLLGLGMTFKTMKTSQEATPSA